MAYAEFHYRPVIHPELDNDEFGRYELTLSKRTKEGQQIVGVSREFMCCPNDRSTAEKSAGHYAERLAGELYQLLDNSEKEYCKCDWQQYFNGGQCPVCNKIRNFEEWAKYHDAIAKKGKK